MKNDASISDILTTPIMRATVDNVFGTEPYEVIARPGAFLLALRNEPSTRSKRIIILKPHGFTANSTTELSSHPEAREATIEIKGAVRTGNNGYFPIKDCVEFVHHNKDGIDTKAIYPYASSNKASREIKTSRTWFKAVKRNYDGFYHNLVNLTDEWLVLILDKKLNLTQKVDYSLLQVDDAEKRDLLNHFVEGVNSVGDKLFKRESELIKHIHEMDPLISLPALITLLNVEEHGKHEQCTVFAVILKIAKKHPQLALDLLKNAEKNNAAQPYYLQELIKKIGTSYDIVDSHTSLYKSNA